MTPVWRLDFLGDSAARVSALADDGLAANAAVHRLAHRVRAAAMSGVRDVVPGMRDLVIHVDPLRCDFTRLSALLDADESDEAERADAASSDLFEIPVTYGGANGPDLEDVARACGLTAADVVRRHAAVEYRVCFIGFLPGFPYLGPLDPVLRLPRRATPRAAVPPGSVAVAGEYSGIYPWSSPGGWHLIGRTDVTLFDAGGDPPAWLAPGSRVRFVPA